MGTTSNNGRLGGRYLIVHPKENYLGINLLHEKRVDVDAKWIVDMIKNCVQEGQLAGTVIGTIRKDGTMQMAFTGTAFDAPLIAKGMANELAALADGYRRHPGMYIPDDD